MSAWNWMQEALQYVWKTVLIQIMAESLWEVILDCLHCISSIPVSLQVVISSCFDDGDDSAQTTAGSGGPSSAEGQSSESLLSSSPDVDEAPFEATSFMWVQHSCCEESDLAKLRCSSSAYIGSWLPLTLLSLLPVSNPPRWPSKHSSTSSRGKVSSHAPNATPSTTAPSLVRVPGKRTTTPPKVCAVSSSASGSMMASLPQHPPKSLAAAKIVRNKVLVLDLDETLIFAATSTANILVPQDFSEVVPTMNGAELYHVWERPFLQLFLDAVSRLFNVVVFTASSPPYADPIIDRIDRGKRIRRRLYRSSCTALHWPEEAASAKKHEGDDGTAAKAQQQVTLSKDLAVLGVPLAHVVLIDNNPCCVAMHRDNGIVVPSYSPPVVPQRASSALYPPSGGGKRNHERASLLLRTVEDTDAVLLGILPFLEALACAADVRSVITRSRLQHS